MRGFLFPRGKYVFFLPLGEKSPFGFFKYLCLEIFGPPFFRPPPRVGWRNKEKNFPMGIWKKGKFGGFWGFFPVSNVFFGLVFRGFGAQKKYLPPKYFKSNKKIYFLSLPGQFIFFYWICLKKKNPWCINRFQAFSPWKKESPPLSFFFLNFFCFYKFWV